MSLGISFGVGFGALFNEVSDTGLLIGAIMDSKAKKSGKIIKIN